MAHCLKKKTDQTVMFVVWIENISNKTLAQHLPFYIPFLARRGLSLDVVEPLSKMCETNQMWLVLDKYWLWSDLLTLDVH